MGATLLVTRAGGRSDVGCVRRNNEDSWSADPESGLYVVCDGMGGHELGELAAELAVGAIRDEVARGTMVAAAAGGGDAGRILERAVGAAHLLVREESERRDLPVHMGTTVVLALVRGAEAWIAHVGDSRAYHFGAQGLRLLTRDHTVARLYAQAGLIAEGAVASHPMRGVLVRCLGAPDGCEVDVSRIALRPGELLVLCSDGLSEMVPEEEIEAIVREGCEPQAIADALIAAALAGGGEDNVTAVVIQANPLEAGAVAP